MKNIIVIVFILICNTGFTQNFEPVKEIPDGKALVYIYRPGNFVGAATKYYVYANQDEVSNCTLKNNSYLYYFAKPGKYTIWDQIDKSNRIVLLTVEAGKTYYVRANCCEFIIPPTEVAESEILECKMKCKD
jgi:hypothetical protein